MVDVSNALAAKRCSNLRALRFLFCMFIVTAYSSTSGLAATRLDSQERRAIASVSYILRLIQAKHLYGEMIDIYSTLKFCSNSEEESASRDEIRRALANAQGAVSVKAICINWASPSMRATSIFTKEYRFNVKVFSDCDQLAAFMSTVIKDRDFLEAMARERLLSIRPNGSLVTPETALSVAVSRATDFFSFSHARIECAPTENEIRLMGVVRRM